MIESDHKPLLPEIVKKPGMLFFTIILPQTLLLMLNAWTLWLVNAESSREHLNTFAIIFAVQITLIVLAGTAWRAARKQQEGIHWLWLLLLFVGQVGFLWYFGTHLWNLIPANVDRWIVDEGMLLFYAFSLMMPGIFYAGLNLACFELPITNRQNLGLSLLMAIGGPSLFYMFFVSGMMLFRSSHAAFTIRLYIYPVLFIGLTVIAFIGLIRLIAFCHNWITERGDPGQMVFAILVGIAGPLGGLTLNRQFPFPADFQALSIYILTIINGMILILPRMNRYTSSVLFLRCVFYPFTFYFFLVFLPFLPLALPAIFALGFGFLILVPVLLFILHTKKIADDYQALRLRWGARTPVFLMVLGLMILPAFFLAQAFSDKAAIKDAITYTYAPDYQEAPGFKGDLNATRRALINLKNFKEGLQLPYLSDVYNRVVFEGMVLPDTKIAEMYHLFTGQDIKKAVLRPGWTSSRRGEGMGLFPSRSRQNFGRRPIIDRNVGLESFQVQTIDEGEYRRAKVRLVMKNLGSDGAEFLTQLNVPPGIVVAGFQLKVDQEMIPGRIFERRTAQWVYHMIRDFVRRDPGILSYISPEQIEMRVFPFNEAQEREAEIVFEFPANFSPVVTIGNKAISLSTNEPTRFTGIWHSNDSKGQNVFFIPPENFPLLPKVQREPYFHFILDRSLDSFDNLSGYAKQIESVAAQYPQIKKCRITAANFSFVQADHWIDPHQAEAVRLALQKISLNRQGGFDPDRVIKTELLRYQAQLNPSLSDANWQIYPIFVVLTPQKPDVAKLKDMEFYRDIVPETGKYLLLAGNNPVEERALWGELTADVPAEVVVLKFGQQVSLIPVKPAKGQIAIFAPLAKEEKSDTRFSVFDTEQKQFIPTGPIKDLLTSEEYSNRLTLLSADKQACLNPAQKESALPALVKESKRLSVLIPSTSFIVVERDAQWKALQINEQKRLKTANAFEFEEDFKTPAPSFWLLMMMLVIFLMIKHWWMVKKPCNFISQKKMT